MKISTKAAAEVSLTTKSPIHTQGQCAKVGCARWDPLLCCLLRYEKNTTQIASSAQVC